MKLALIVTAVGLLFATAPVAAAATIDVVANLQHQNTARLAPAGRAGDAYSSYWVISDRFGRPVGDMLQSCRWVTEGLRLCVGQVTMPRGTIATIGASRTAIIGQFAIVGGTGVYHGADGVLLFKAVSSRRYVLQATYDQ
jgi:hypothetical protein